MAKIYFRLLSISLALFISPHVNGQSKLKKLPPNINQPSIDFYAPFISGDGETILYLSDYTDDGHHTMNWATKKTVSSWNDGRQVNKLINRPTLNFRGGYSLGFEGDILLFTSRKSGLGGFDLWYSKRRGDDWDAPKNFGVPINSNSNEGSPMLSPDGEHLYFMRCEQMSEYGGAKNCQLMVSKKTYSGWEDPIALPANINTGNSQMPRILADGETLIFASDQLGGKGGLDLYMATKTGNGWSDPVPLDFLNTEKDDAFVSIPAKGRYAYVAMKGERNSELVEVLIPEAFQPRKVMRVSGVVTDALTKAPIDANLTVFNIGARDRLWNKKTGPNGEFNIVLKEGQSYDLSVDNGDPTYMYYSQVFALDTIGTRDKQKLTIKLQPIRVNDSSPCAIYFTPHSSEIADVSTFELRRMADLMRKNPTMQIEVGVHLHNYRSDTVRSDPDLTEVHTDSIWGTVKAPILAPDTTATSEEIDALLDSLNTVPKVASTDSTATRDLPDTAQYKLIEVLTIQHTYHNDRTKQQAAAIKAYLIKRNVEENRIMIKGYRDHQESENPISVMMTILRL